MIRVSCLPSTSRMRLFPTEIVSAARRAVSVNMDAAISTPVVASHDSRLAEKCLTSGSSTGMAWFLART